MSQYLDINKQIVHLAIDKSIMFKHDELKLAEKILRDNNYRNFVSCSKINFAEFFAPNLIMYKTAPFKEWLDYFDMDCRVSHYLMENLIKFERVINSRLSHLISDMMANGDFTDYEKNEIVQMIQSWQMKMQRVDSCKKIRERYTGQKTWELLPKMTFGVMKNILFWLKEHREDKYLEIVKGYTFLEDLKNARLKFDEINRLRNNLAHFRPLTVFLTHGATSYFPKKRKRVLNNTYRKDAVDFTFNLHSNLKIEKELEEIYKSSDNYVDIKNSQQNAG